MSAVTIRLEAGVGSGSEDTGWNFLNPTLECLAPESSVLRVKTMGGSDNDSK